MNLFKHLNPIAFIISFSIGILIVCIKQPVKKIVYKYPTPFNSDKIIYRDNENGCFKFKVTDVVCPTDKSKIKEQPINY
jgi:hypothetical protein